VAHLGAARAALRDVQGGGDARRADDDPRRALGLRRGESTARARAARGVGCGRRGHGDGSGGCSSARCAFGKGPLPAGSELELLGGDLEGELARLGGEGVQSLLLEGGATLAGAFFRADLVDKVLLFVAPKLSGEGPGLAAGLAEPVTLTSSSARRVGQDVLLTAYVHEP
jgi:hypothetical protein